MTEQEINNLIDSKIGKVKMSQLPEATQTSGLYSIGYTGNQSVKFKTGLLQGDPLTVRKTYQTEALALADKNPIDATTSLPLKIGQFVSIVNDGEKNGIYRIGSISGDGTMSLELQGKLGDLSDYAKKGGSTKTLKEVDDEKADHGYASIEVAKTLKEVEDNASVKIKNEAVNGNFENGLIAPFSKGDGQGGESTLAINSSTPISGNYDIRFTITTPATGNNRPIFRGLHGAANIGDKIYLHFYAKILSGTPHIWVINNGEGNVAVLEDVINGRNSIIIDVLGKDGNLGLIYFNSPSVWDMQMDNFMRINLTESFGAGNEPTKEQMDALMDIVGHFDGDTISQNQLMRWMLGIQQQSEDKIYEKANHGYIEEEPKTLKEVEDNIQEELTLLDAYIKSDVEEEYTVGTTSTSITGLVSQSYTDYFWVLNTELPAGELKKINVLSDGNTGIYNFYLLAPGEDFTVKVKIPVTLPDNAGVPSVISLIAGTDFDAGIMVQEGWKLARLKRTGAGSNYYLDKNGQPTNSAYLKVITTEPEVNSIISEGSYFAWKPEFSCTILERSINKRLEYLNERLGDLESDFIDTSSLQDEVNEHEGRISVLENMGIPADIHNVATYGAVGDGVTDDTVSIQNAVNANEDSYIVFNDGTYRLTNSILINKNIRLEGNFRSTFIKGEGNFPLISVSGGRYAQDGLTFMGSGRSENSTKPLQDGILLLGATNKINIQNTECYDLAGIGIHVRNIVSTVGAGFFEGSSIHNVNAYNCNEGVRLGVRAEFINLTNFNIVSCGIGLRVAAGNSVIGDGSLVKNGIGLYIEDGANSAHGTISNVGIKHNTQYSIYAEETQIGFIFSALSIFDGNIYLKNVRGFHFSGCHLDASNYYFEGAMRCRFVNNLIHKSAYTLHNDYKGVVSEVEFDNTFVMND